MSHRVGLILAPDDDESKVNIGLKPHSSVRRDFRGFQEDHSISQPPDDSSQGDEGRRTSQKGMILSVPFPPEVTLRGESKEQCALFLVALVFYFSFPRMWVHDNENSRKVTEIQM